MNIGAKALEIALSQEGVREATGHNDGAPVEKYLKGVGLGKGYSWCMAFVYWCATQAAILLEEENPLLKTGGVLAQWNKRKNLRVEAPEPGDVFIIDYGKGKGHTGFVVSVGDKVINTIEGNTNDKNSREGDGVYRRTRSMSSIKGYLRI